MSNKLPHGDNLWSWIDSLTVDGQPFLFQAGDVLVLEITHTKTWSVVERTAQFTVGTNAVSYIPQSSDITDVETLHLRWKLTRAGLVAHFPTDGYFDLVLT